MIANISSFAVAFLAATSAASVFKSTEASTAISNHISSTSVTKSFRNSYHGIHRKLENGDEKHHQENHEEYNEEPTDLSNFSIIFDKCEYIEEFLDNVDLENDKGAKEREAAVAMKQFIIFRLCRSDVDNHRDDCETHMVDIEDYLGITVRYREDMEENMCELCNESCVEGDTNTSRHLGLRSSRKLLDCDACTKTCEKIRNMEENGYIDATTFINCQQIVDDDKISLYAGPMCGGGQGSKVMIDVFEDEGCMIHDPSKNVEDYITDQDGYAIKISHNLLKQTYDNTEPIVCGTFDKDGNTFTKTKEVCTDLYEAARRYEQTQTN